MARNVEESVHTKSISDIDEEILVCTICYERMAKPKILPCMHTFCEKCLETWVATNKGELICPTCRSEFPLPETGVSGLSNNLFINDLLEIFHKVRPESPEKPIWCEACDGSAQYWCQECAQLFCEICRSSHERMRMLRDHTFISVAEFSKLVADGSQCLLQPKFCSRHPQSQLELFCDSCQATVCIRCAVTSHKGDSHHLLSLEEATKKYMPALKSLEQKLGSTVTFMKEIHEAKKKALGDFQTGITDTKAKIRAHAEKVTAQIKEQEDTLLQEVHQFGRWKSKQIKADIAAFEFDIEFLKSMEVYVKNFLQYGSQADVLSQKAVMEKRLSDITSKSSNSRAKSEMRPEKSKEFDMNPLSLNVCLGNLKNDDEESEADISVDGTNDEDGSVAPPPQKSETSQLVAQSELSDVYFPFCDKCKLAAISRYIVKAPCCHQFCQRCSPTSQNALVTCPVCSKVFGSMPFGRMWHEVACSYLPGFGCTTLVVTYDFPPGIQQATHPQPGKRYEGATFYAYLPNNHEGREILRLLRIAFDRRLTFAIDGATGNVTWNGITHRLSKMGPERKEGEERLVPDIKSLVKMKEQLASRGVK